MHVEQNVDTVIATPHFYADETSFDGFLNRREKAYKETMTLYEEGSSLPKILKGAEVYFFSGMGKAERLSELTVEGTDLLLLEMPFTQWTRSVYDEVRRIVEERHLQVVLAHLERFYPLQKDMTWLNAVLDLPVYVQMNTGCFDSWSGRRLAKKIVKLNKPTVLGSDCHSLHRRPVDIQKGLAIAEKKLGQDTVRKIQDTSYALLKKHALA